ncbi:MAG TPA: rhodanese-like domain-containing protein [Lapidilactobacillus dextrinicus]|jgi:rhodanese-related sulfurtransferase|uniref:Rhodanese domain-containing protein n=2 Tax=Lapidilactobacillus dextrinicus TaxID=51664 RepID=A0A0R2BFX4_9LACO|nr:rhodanese-like domain-containing protein [Lapidilactobacillus dextrinicus]KRM78382.1 hypothetical protein FC84_GL000915 [Lapidilactobacillus dextrinicus DSM 20335]QFG46567.1 rhodanese-like domain-containing protein [Lapidilactobacillus dextrinicus]HJE15408.1 rhodanese-like domain-containing protein [Lapidilactobacillus dextrinicus]
MFGLFNRIPSISTKELKSKLNPKIVLLDVRTPAEYRSGHIAEARNLPLNRISTYHRPTTEPIYLICQSGARSKQAARLLTRQGYQVINVRGGMNQWSGPVRGGK